MAGKNEGEFTRGSTLAPSDSGYGYGGGGGGGYGLTDEEYPDYFDSERNGRNPYWTEEDIKRERGADNFRNSPLGAWAPSFTPFYGGGDLELADIREQMRMGRMAGNAITEKGVGYMDRAANMMGYGAELADRNRRNAMLQANEGRDIGRRGMSAEDAYIASMIDAAGADAGSAAVLQQQMANDTQVNQMMAQAASARGGNQAAAMRNAQAQGSQNALVNNQNIALLRQQEDQARLQRMAQANQSAAASMGTRANMGYNTQNQGLGNANAATNTFGDFAAGTGTIGKNTADVGTTTTGQYLNAENNANTAQLNADTERANKQRESTQNAFSSGLGGIVKGFLGF